MIKVMNMSYSYDNMTVNHMTAVVIMRMYIYCKQYLVISHVNHIHQRNIVDYTQFLMCISYMHEQSLMKVFCVLSICSWTYLPCVTSCVTAVYIFVVALCIFT